MANPRVDSEDRNRIVVENAFKAWHDGTGGPYELLADNATWTITGRSLAAKVYPDKESFLREVIRPFNARMRERLIPTTVHELVADGDRVVIRFDAAGTAADGRPYVNSYAWFLTILLNASYQSATSFLYVARSSACASAENARAASARKCLLMLQAPRRMRRRAAS